MMHPTHNGGVGHRQAALGHHLHQIPEAQLEAQVPPHAQDDDLAIKVPPVKHPFTSGSLAIASPSTHPWAAKLQRPAICTRAIYKGSFRRQSQALVPTMVATP